MHDEAARAEDTDWPQILALYGLLKRMSDNPMVTLNHAIAAAMVHGPRRGSSCSRRSTPTRGWPATIASTPCAATCSRWPATTSARLPTTGPRRSGRRASRSVFIC